MITRFFRRLPMPKRLRWQFTLALSVPAFLIVAGCLIAFNDLRISSYTTRQLAEVRVIRMQQAQDLVQCTLLIERESHRMLTADSLDSMQDSYREILKRLDVLDSLVLRLGQASNDLSVLALNHAGQLFRNTVHIVAQLRKNLLINRFAPHELARQQEIFFHFQNELQRQAVSLVDATGSLSAHFTRDHKEAMRQATAASEQHQRRMLALLAGSVLLAWLVSRYFLGKRVAARLQQVSNCLRLGETSSEFPQVPVQGDDEIGDMARAVEQFLEDRRLLVQTQHDLRQNEEMLRAIIEAAPVAIIGLDLDGNVHSVWNRAAERMLGWSAREVMGRPLPTVPEENEEKFRRFRQQIRNGMTLDGIEVCRKKRDGTPIDYSIYASPLHDPECNITGNISVLVDITEKKQALSQVKQLSGLLPICAQCKKIRDDRGYWNAIELYISEHSEASFSHGICEECSEKLYGGEAWYAEMKRKQKDPQTAGKNRISGL